MSREDKLAEVQELAKIIKREIPVGKFIRKRIVQEEVVEAYKSPIPSAVIVNGRPRQVEIGDWIVIHADGSRDTYKASEFGSIFDAHIEKPEASDVRRK